MKNSKIQKSKSSKSNNSKELWFLCIALQLNEIYLPMKFNVDALHSFKVMFRTKKGRTDGQTDRRTSQSLYATLRGHKTVVHGVYRMLQI